MTPDDPILSLFISLLFGFLGSIIGLWIQNRR